MLECLGELRRVDYLCCAEMLLQYVAIAQERWARVAKFSNIGTVEPVDWLQSLSTEEQKSSHPDIHHCEFMSDNDYFEFPLRLSLDGLRCCIVLARTGGINHASLSLPRRIPSSERACEHSCVCTFMVVEYQMLDRSGVGIEGTWSIVICLDVEKSLLLCNVFFRSCSRDAMKASAASNINIYNQIVPTCYQSLVLPVARTQLFFALKPLVRSPPRQ